MSILYTFPASFEISPENFKYTGDQANTAPSLYQDTVKKLFSKFYSEYLGITSIKIKLNTLQGTDFFRCDVTALIRNRYFIYSEVDETAIKALNKVHDMLEQNVTELMDRRRQRQVEL